MMGVWNGYVLPRLKDICSHLFLSEPYLPLGTGITRQTTASSVSTAAGRVLKSSGKSTALQAQPVVGAEASSGRVLRSGNATSKKARTK